MAQLAHPQSQMIPATTRTRRLIGGAILALLVAGAVVLALTLPSNDSTPANPSVLGPPAPVSVSSAAAVRSDGGPNEGTRGAVVLSPTTGVRFDGGPQEGTRGHASVAPGTRFDGGPNEGTRGAR